MVTVLHKFKFNLINMVTHSTIITRNVTNISYLVNLTGEKESSKVIKKETLRFKFSIGTALNSTKSRICPPLCYTVNSKIILKHSHILFVTSNRVDKPLLPQLVLQRVP